MSPDVLPGPASTKPTTYHLRDSRRRGFRRATSLLRGSRRRRPPGDQRLHGTPGHFVLARQILGPLLGEVSFEQSRGLADLDQVAVGITHLAANFGAAIDPAEGSADDACVIEGSAGVGAICDSLGPGMAMAWLIKRFQISAGNEPPVTCFIGERSSFPTQTPATRSSLNPMNQASR